MLNYIFQIIFLILMMYVSYKTKMLLVSNYFIGFFLLLFFTWSNFEGVTNSLMIRIMMFMFNLIFYTVLFTFSSFIYFDNEDNKRHYFIIPFISYFVLAFLESITLNVDDSFSSMFVPVFIAFFPLFVLKHYLKYIK